MPSYSDFADRIFLQPKLLHRLRPTQPLGWDLVHRIGDASDSAIFAPDAIADAGMASLIRGGLLYAVDAIDHAHRIFQDAKSDLGSYWHGMIHRREGDFDNARYWFRRSGRLPFFQKLHREAAESSSLVARQIDWDPYLFTGQCEQVRFGAEEDRELALIQRAEFELIFDYCWRQAVKSAAPKPG
jgi:hypothetical protein